MKNSPTANAVWNWIKIFFLVIGVIGGIAYFWNIVLGPLLRPLFN